LTTRAAIDTLAAQTNKQEALKMELLILSLCVLAGLKISKALGVI
jgi:hypothetical protein